MEKIVMISPAVPNENGWGIERRAANELKALSKKFDVYLIIIKLHDKGTRISDHLKSLCNDVLHISVKVGGSLIKPWFKGFSLINEIIQPIHRRNMPDIIQMDVINDFLNRSLATKVFCFRLRSAVVFRELERKCKLRDSWKKIVDIDDIESIAIKRELEHISNEGGFEYNLIQRIRALRLSFFESMLLKKFDTVFCCSTLDKKKLIDKYGCDEVKIRVLPNCVPIPSLYNENKQEYGGINILFVGAMQYLPNKDAVIWFTEEIYPKIIARATKSVTLTLVGFDPDKRVRNLGLIPGVTVTGSVESVEPYLHKCDIFVAPIRFGGGTRIKILEAMSYGVPVIATSMGAEGIAAENNREIVLADDAQSISEACLKLISDKTQREGLSVNGQALVTNNYTLKAVSKIFQESF
ncbi:MAG: glycosyltransferase [Motiliproteus sp.]